MHESSKQVYRRFRADWRKGAQHAPEADVPSKERRTKRGTPWREYLAWLRPFWNAVIGIYVLAIVSALLSLALPLATKHIIDVVIPARDLSRLQLLGWILIGIIIVQQSFDFARNWRTAILNARFLFRLRQRLYDHLLRLPLHKLSQLKTGGITSRLSGDVDSITGLIQMGIITPAVATSKVLLTITILLMMNWRMSVAAMLLLPIIVVLNLTYIRRVRPIYRSMRKDRGEIDGRVVETFGGIRVVRAFRRERTEAVQYARRHHAVIRKRLLAQFLEFFVWSGWGFLIPLAALVTIWYGGALVISDQLTIGGIMAFQMYLMMLLAPISAIVRSYGEMQQGLAAMERIHDLLDEAVEKPDRPDAVAAPRRVERMEFDRVSFAYDQGPAVLHDVSLVVPGGATVALVGPSGAGKTTVTNLVARFHDPTAGAVRLNGVDLHDLKLRSYRELIGLVQQDVFLFDGTIAENIAYGRPSATDADIRDAAHRANAHTFIDDFPDGYETIVGERGVRLSGGQAQRVSIARALLADCQILILDEATSNLDSESEQLIQASLTELLQDRTTFVIAHRLSTVVHADLIVVLDAGRVVDAGTHTELMAGCEFYRQMVERQQRGMSFDGDAVEAAGWLE